MKKIYTGYYGNIRAYNEMVKVAISLGMPKWADMPNLRMLNPRRWMMDLPDDEYVVKYQAMLETLSYKDIIKTLDAVSLERDVVLLCYESPGLLCHRHLVADWINKRGEYEVTEYYGKPTEPKPEPQKQGKPEQEQLMLFDLPRPEREVW